ncbi:hypothetical protein [Streptomyces sp. NPDC046821]|uniref:hypothetical protein n=1 Tax=Streptomyces sp. NPDC046821 TaxID=3154702 RepID=UPI0033C6DF52
MKCGEVKPGDTWRACDRDIEHSGDHTYLGDRWPRPEPAEPDWDVHELLEDAIPANAWGIEERSYPVIVTETITRVLWVDAESEDKALTYWANDYCDIPLRDADVIDGGLEFERPDQWQRQAAFKPNRAVAKVGPLIACPDCGKEAFRRSWIHDPYRKCHGPIEWRISGLGRPRREFRETPVHAEAVAA